jgi:hypothetical protein
MRTAALFPGLPTRFVDTIIRPYLLKEMAIAERILKLVLRIVGAIV